MISSIRLDGSIAPMVVNGASNKNIFRVYIKTFLLPTLYKGDVIILNNLSTYKGKEI